MLGFGHENNQTDRWVPPVRLMWRGVDGRRQTAIDGHLRRDIRSSREPLPPSSLSTFLPMLAMASSADDSDHGLGGGGGDCSNSLWVRTIGLFGPDPDGGCDLGSESEEEKVAVAVLCAQWLLGGGGDGIGQWRQL